MEIFIQKLRQALQTELPGASAHQLMSPVGRGNTEEYINKLEAPAKISAVMLLLFIEDATIKMVLIKRPDYQGVHSGQISFPGGKFEEGDIDYEQTAYRETFEEVGIPRQHIELLGALSRIYIPPSNFLVYPFVGYTSTLPTFKPDKKEVQKIIVSPIDVLLKEEIRKEGSFTAGGTIHWQIKAPYYEIENEKVWGATAAILSEFKTILQKLKVE